MAQAASSALFMLVRSLAPSSFCVVVVVVSPVGRVPQRARQHKERATTRASERVRKEEEALDPRPEVRA
jgi:hypothetical protein